MVLYLEIITHNSSGLEIKSGQRSPGHDQKEIRLCRVYDNYIPRVCLPVWQPGTTREIFVSRNYWTEDGRTLLCSCATSPPDSDIVPGTHRHVLARRESITAPGTLTIALCVAGEVQSVLCSDVLATVTERLDLVAESRSCSLQ